MQRESTFRLDSIPFTEEIKKKSEALKEKIISAYDLINEFNMNTPADMEIITQEIYRCFAIAKTKLQECMFWTNRGLSYDPKQFTEH